MPKLAYLGLDLGTTGIKALLVSPEGEVLRRLERPLALSTPKPAWAEQNPDDWWKETVALLKTIPKSIKIIRIGLSGQMHTLVPLGEKRNVLRPAILWCDQRSSSQCDQATRILGGEDEVLKSIGNPIYPGFTLPKIMWLKDNEPNVFRKLKTILIAKDYLAYKLTGEIGTELSDASGTSMLDVAKGEWRIPLMLALELDPSVLPPIGPSEGTRGILSKKLASELGWDQIEVASGGADNAVSALGLGIIEPGDCMISIGTSGTVLGVTKSRVPDPKGRLHYFRHVIGGSFYRMGVMLSAGAALNWAKSMIAPDLGWPELENGMAETPPGGDGLLFLPYLQGERTPHRDPDARGVLFGLSTMSSPGSVLRSVMEGVTFGLRDSFELLKELEASNRVILAGGGAKNKLWREILAANLKTPVIAPVVDEGGAYGAAMLAAMGDAAGADVKSWAKAGGETRPDQDLANRYDAIYEQFKMLYQDLAKRFKEVARLGQSGAFSPKA